MVSLLCMSRICMSRIQTKVRAFIIMTTFVRVIHLLLFFFLFYRLWKHSCVTKRGTFV